MTAITYHAAQIQIDGFGVTLTVGDGVSECLIEFDEYGGTLDFVEEYGIILNDDINEMMVPKKTIAEIKAWAESEGY